MVQIEKNENGIAKAIDLFDGMNVHPIPMDFSNSMTTTEFLLNLQNKVNELITLWNESYEKLEELTEQQKQEILNTITTKIAEIKEEYTTLLNTNIGLIEQKLTEEKKNRIESDNNLKTELLAKINDLDTILNLINKDGEQISLSELFTNYSNINGKFTNLEKNVNNMIAKFNELKTQVNDFIENIATCHFISQENIEIPESLINDKIESIALTYSSKKINDIISSIKTDIEHLTNVINTIGNTDSDTRDRVASLEKSIVNNLNSLDDITQLNYNRILQLSRVYKNNLSIIIDNINKTYNEVATINNKLNTKFSDWSTVMGGLGLSEDYFYHTDF